MENNIVNVENKGSKRHCGINYLSRKEFKNEKSKNPDVKIVGETILRKEKNTNHYGCILKAGEEFYKVEDKKFRRIKGYISIGNNEYIAYKGLSVLIPIILALVLLGACYLLGNNHDGKIQLEDFKPIDLSNNGKSTQEIKTYDFETQGAYAISADNPAIKVWNPESNSRIFRYTIYLDGKVVATTEGIRPGNMVEVDLSQFLDKKGEHDLTLGLEVLDENDGTVVGEAERPTTLNIQ